MKHIVRVVEGVAQSLEDAFFSLAFTVEGRVRRDQITHDVPPKYKRSPLCQAMGCAHQFG